MGDFSDDYGGYDILGLYEQRDEDRRAQRAKLLTLPAKRAWVGLTNEQREDIINNSMTPACVVIATESKLKELNK